jgi:hypothetical protein
MHPRTVEKRERNKMRIEILCRSSGWSIGHELEFNEVQVGDIYE